MIPGNSVTTTFTVAASDGILPAVSDSTTTVIATAVNNPPTILGTTANQAVNDSGPLTNTTVLPFTGVTFDDPDLSDRAGVRHGHA